MPVVIVLYVQKFTFIFGSNLQLVIRETRLEINYALVNVRLYCGF